MNTELSVEELIEPLQTVIGVVEKKTNTPNTFARINSTKGTNTYTYNNRYGVGN